MPLPKEYDDLPGTIVFDADRAREGYHLNMFCMSMMKPENRAAFKENERAYLDQWPMTEAQNAYLSATGTACCNSATSISPPSWPRPTGFRSSRSPPRMSGSTQEEYAQMMIRRRRPIEGNRSKSEWKNRG